MGKIVLGVSYPIEPISVGEKINMVPLYDFH